MARGDEATERGLSVSSAALDFGVNSFAISAEAARLDVQGDEVGISYGCVASSFFSLSPLTNSICSSIRLFKDLLL